MSQEWFWHFAEMRKRNRLSIFPLPFFFLKISFLIEYWKDVKHVSRPNLSAQKKLEKSFFFFFSKPKEQAYFQCYVTLYYQTQHIWNCFQKHTWHTWHIPLTLILYFAFFFFGGKQDTKQVLLFFSCKMWRQAQVVM